MYYFMTKTNIDINILSKEMIFLASLFVRVFDKFGAAGVSIFENKTGTIHLLYTIQTIHIQPRIIEYPG